LKKGWVNGIWKLVPFAIWWCTCKERNQQIFKGKASSLYDFKLFFRMLYYSQALDSSSKVSLLKFVAKIMLKSLKA